MASEIGVKLVIGAAVSGAFQTVLGGARKTVDALGETARRVEARHARLGEVMARAMTHPARPLAELRQRYETLGRTLDQIRAKSDALSRSLSQGEALKAAREQKLSAMRETAGAARLPRVSGDRPDDDPRTMPVSVSAPRERGSTRP